MMNDPLDLATLMLDRQEANGQNPRSPLCNGESAILAKSYAEAIVMYLKANAVIVDESGTWPLQ